MLLLVVLLLRLLTLAVLGLVVVALRFISLCCLTNGCWLLNSACWFDGLWFAILLVTYCLFIW